MIGQHTKQGERQSYVKLAQHGAGPIADGVLLFQIQLGYHQIQQQTQVGEEHVGTGRLCAKAHQGQNQIGGTQGGNGAVDADFTALVKQVSELVHAKCGNQCKQQAKRKRAVKDTAH